jgi:hypothetical protein
MNPLEHPLIAQDQPFMLIALPVNSSSGTPTSVTEIGNSKLTPDALPPEPPDQQDHKESPVPPDQPDHPDHPDQPDHPVDKDSSAHPVKMALLDLLDLLEH